MKPQFVVFTAGKPKTPLHLAVAKDNEEEGGDGVVVSSHSDPDGKTSLRVWNMKASSIPVELLGQGIIGTNQQQQQQREPSHAIEITGPIHGLQLSNDKYLAVILDTYVEIYDFEQLTLQSSSDASFLLQTVPILRGKSNFTCSWSKNVYDSKKDESYELLVLLFGEDVLVVSPVDGILSSACVHGCRSIDWMPQIQVSTTSNGNGSSSESQQSYGCSGMLLALAVDDQVLLMDPLHHVNQSCRSSSSSSAAASSSDDTHVEIDRTIQPNDDITTDDISVGFSVVATFRPIYTSQESSQSVGLVMHVHWTDPLSILLITTGKPAGTASGQIENNELCYNVCVLEIPEVLLQWSSGQSLRHGDTIDIAIAGYVGDTTSISPPVGDGRERDGVTTAASTARRPRCAHFTQQLSLPSFSSHKRSVGNDIINNHENARFFTGFVDRHSYVDALTGDNHTTCKGHEQWLFVGRSHSDLVHMIFTETTTTTTSNALIPVNRNVNNIVAGTASSSASASALNGSSSAGCVGRLLLHPTVSSTLKIPSVNDTMNNGAAGGGAGAAAAAAASFSLAEMMIIDHQKVPVHCHMPRRQGKKHLSSVDRGVDSFRGINSVVCVDVSVILRADPLLFLRDGPSGAMHAVAIARSVFPLHLVDPATPAAPSLQNIKNNGSSDIRSNETTLSPFTGNVWETSEELQLASTIATDSKTLIDAFSSRVARLSEVIVDGAIATPQAIGAGNNGRSNLGEMELPRMTLDAQNKVADLHHKSSLPLLHPIS